MKWADISPLTHTSTYANFENLLHIRGTLADIPLQHKANSSFVIISKHVFILIDVFSSTDIYRKKKRLVEILQK